MIHDMKDKIRKNINDYIRGDTKSTFKICIKDFINENDNDSNINKGIDNINGKVEDKEENDNKNYN